MNNEYRLPFKPGMQVIELGGGATPRFHPNADVRWLPQVDIVCDFNYPLTIPTGEYDGIYCSYAIEHISWRKVRGLIAECHRILKPGGVGVVITANLKEQCRVLAQAEEWNDDLVCTIFGDQNYQPGWDGNAHHCGFSPEYAIRLFTEAGFYEVKVFPIQTGLGSTDMLIEARKSKAVIRGFTAADI